MLEYLDNGEDGVEDDGLLVPYAFRSKAAPRRRGKPSKLVMTLAGAAITLVVLVFAVQALWHMLSEVSLQNVVSALSGISILAVMASMLLVACSYLALTGYDWTGLSHLGRRLPYPKVALGSFLSYAFANNLGFALLTGGTIRYRIYSSERVTASDVAILTVVCGLTFALSAALMVGICLVAQPAATAAVLHLPQPIAIVLGAVLLAALAAYVVWVGLKERAVTMSSVRLVLPGSRATMAQLAVGAADILCAAAALYVLLPGDPGVGYLVFVSVFAAAIALGIISHVPGGLGVFETVMLLALPGLSTDQILASLLVYRCVYYFLPLLLAIALLLWYEVNRIPVLNPGSRRIAAMVRLGRRWLRAAQHGAVHTLHGLLQLAFRIRRPLGSSRS
jgi:uncharacterized membrane protein YbhN (UPF0104 family)